MGARYAWLGAATISVVAFVNMGIGCGSDDEPVEVTTGAGGTATGGSAGTGGADGGADDAATGGSAGQDQDAASGGTGGQDAAAGGTGGVGGSGGDGGTGGTGGGAQGGHVFISEVGILGSNEEFIEIWNPTSSAVDLSDYYIADNSAYHTVTAGPWAPLGTPGTDFLVRFPAGTTIAPDDVIVVGANATGYESAFGTCPDFFLTESGAAVSCAGGSRPSMTIPPNGSVGDSVGSLISNEREMVILFHWDGTSSIVHDVDYVTWGATFDGNTRVDKSGESGYQADTPRAAQKPAVTGFQPGDAGPPDGGGSAISIARCSAGEPSEAQSGGNGLTGHNETSEDMATSFQSQTAPSPGQKNSCLN